MRILLVGAGGLVGTALQAALGSHNLIRASRSGADAQVDITEPASIKRLMVGVGALDAVVCVAGVASLGSLADASADDWAQGVAGKLLGQMNLVREACRVLQPRGHIVLTSGQLGGHPVRGSALASTVNAGVEAFVRAASLDLPHLRVNAVSPGWISETLVALGRSPDRGVSVRDVAEAYAVLLASDASGTVVRPGAR